MTITREQAIRFIDTLDREPECCDGFLDIPDWHYSIVILGIKKVKIDAVTVLKALGVTQQEIDDATS